MNRTESNRRLRLLAVIDGLPRESLAIEFDWPITSSQVIDVLRYLLVVRGARSICAAIQVPRSSPAAALD
ncbi:MAG: hypothetical protein CMJ58_02115 [Planctomycetaceae bacterium]|nr:hypothetical protein [Planctomycetaceae bacterium]